jgi:8-oxo-dGTP diphosphatase
MERVALIRKERPNWQKGLLNGIGGHIEGNEAPIDAMGREFFEETGIKVSIYDWKRFCVMEGSGFQVFCFKACWKGSGVEPVMEKITDEIPCWYDLDYLHTQKPLMIPNLQWLIPMAKDSNDFDAEIQYKELKGDS